MNPATEVSSFALNQWTTDSGLPQNSVQAFTEDEEGYLWVGTQNGLVRFDGARFQSFTPANTPALRNVSITTLCQASDGTLWIGTDGGGVARFQNGRFEAVPEAAALRYIRCIRQAPDGSIWIASNLAVQRWDGARLAMVLDASQQRLSLRSIFIDAEGVVWVAHGSGVARIERGATTWFGQNEGLRGNMVRCVSADRAGTIWVGTASGLFKLERGRFTFVDLGNTTEDGVIRALCHDRDGTLWIGTNSGVVRMANGRTERCVTRGGAPFELTLAIHEDRSGRIWIGTEAGMASMRDVPIRHLSMEQGLSQNIVLSVLRTRDGTLWVGTWSTGLNRVVGRTVTPVGTAAGLTNKTVNALHEDAVGDVWIGTDRGLARWHDGKVQPMYVEHVGSAKISNITSTPDGALWVVAASTVHRFLGGQHTVYKEAEGRPLELVRSLCVAPDGTLWLAAQDFVGRLVDGAWQVIEPTSRGNLRPFGLYFDGKGDLWVMGEVETYRYSGGAWHTYTEASGLPFSGLISMIDDRRGHLWFTSNRGLLRVARSAFDDVDAQKGQVTFELFDESDGLRTRLFTSNSSPLSVLTDDGLAYFATNKGVAVVAVDQVRPKVAPRPVIESVAVGANTVLRLSDLKFDPGTRSIEVMYTAPDASAGNSLEFRHRIEPLDSDWTEAGTRRVAHYAELKPGRYTFHVSVRRAGGAWSEPATLTFQQLPHFYETSWFYGLAALGFIASVGGMYRWRIGALESKERAARAAQAELEQKVAQRTAELSQTNSKLQEQFAERLRMEAALKHERDLIDLFLETVPDMIYFKDRESRILKCNRAYAQRFGYPDPAMMVGKMPTDLFSPNEAILVAQEDRQVVESAQPLIGRTRRCDGHGSEAWHMSTKLPLRGADGALIGTFGVTRDVTELISVQEELRESRTFYMSLVESLPQHIVRRDRSGRITFANQLYCDLVGRSLDDLMGKTDAETLPASVADRSSRADREVATAGKSVEWVQSYTAGDGRELLLQMIRLPIFDSAGVLVGTQSVSWDITEKHRAEEELRRTQKELIETSRLAGMAEVASGVLHNVGNVLNSVNVSAHIIAEGVQNTRAATLDRVAGLLEEHAADFGRFLTTDPRGQKVPEFIIRLATQLQQERADVLREVKQLKNNIDHIKHIVDMHQSYARVSGLAEDLPIEHLIEDALRMNTSAWGGSHTRIVRELSTVPLVRVQKHKVLQILTNLLRNAKHALEDAQCAEPVLTLRTELRGEFVAVAVMDNGVGIPPENLVRIFSHGFTTRKGGHGFGLHSSALAAKEMGGALVAASEGVGRGATFTLTLPVAAHT